MVENSRAHNFFLSKWTLSRSLIGGLSYSSEGNLKRQEPVLVERDVKRRCRYVVCMLVGLMLACAGCATALVRSDGGTEEFAVYPASSVDVMFTRDVVISGESPFGSVGEYQIKPLSRVVYGLGVLIDLPISIASDTLLLPFDVLSRSKGGSGGQNRGCRLETFSHVED